MTLHYLYIMNLHQDTDHSLPVIFSSVTNIIRISFLTFRLANIPAKFSCHPRHFERIALNFTLYETPRFY